MLIFQDMTVDIGLKFSFKFSLLLHVRDIIFISNLKKQHYEASEYL